MQLKVKSVGNTNPSGRGMNGNVFDSDYLCPTLTTNKGEGIKILIKNATKKGYLIADDGDGIDTAYPDSETRRGRVQKNMAHTITTDDSKGGVIGTIYTNVSKRFQGGVYKNLSRTVKASNHDLSVVIVASRGRDPKNPSDRKAGNNNLQQRLETSNTITTVQKDNYVVEGIDVHPFSKKLEFGGYRQKEISPCLLATDYKAPKTILKSQTNSFCVQKDNRVVEPSDKKIIIDDTMGFEKEDRVYEGYSPSLRASRGGLKTMSGQDLRIRKLTPKECWRLMGCSDEDFHKAEQVNSNSQLYKQAGNAIVVDVLEAIFKQMFLK